MTCSVKRRLVFLNVEEGTWEEQYRVWPHLGLLFVGTIAQQEGWEVILWDEFVQGPAPLDALVEHGDVVGLSLVATGISRGIDIARRAKKLGAAYVIAGNDAAAFRAEQLLHGSAIDAVFTSNSLRSLRAFFCQIARQPLEALRIPGVATRHSLCVNPSNVYGDVAQEAGQFSGDDFFIVPDLSLYAPGYWEAVWKTYRSQYGHKHLEPAVVSNATVLLGQGCTRAGAGDVCDYCTIRHVADVRIPNEQYLQQTVDAYRRFGINTFFNTTDSAFEMGRLAHKLQRVNARFDSLVIYGRAQGMATRPDLFERWLALVNDRLLINCGMDSADETILRLGVNKSPSRGGSRVEENKQAIRNLKAAGSKAHLHYSLIFGSSGETRDSCERNMEFLQWTIDQLGSQLDVVESDIFWVNFGAPCSAVFYRYEEAVQRAALAGKSITRQQWREHFWRHRNAIIVPEAAQEAWYQFFTRIDLETAEMYNDQVSALSETLPSAIPGRRGAFQART